MKKAFLVALLVLLVVGACFWTMVEEPAVDVPPPPPSEGTNTPAEPR